MKILSEQDYDEALARIDQLMDVSVGTPESAELETLVTAVEAYEAIHHPIDSPDPESPFDSPILTPALDLNGQGYWLGHAGQGVEDAVQMREEHSQEFQRLIASGELAASDERYVRAVQQRLTLYKHKLQTEK